jgi:2-polyprenyl-6-methoxyphenol hydroxylase-like FAD-dependent oxidoreductase
MTTAVAGAGPVGLVCAAALAATGEDVLLLDRDPGPGPDGAWRRRGVMQFSHPHFFRHLVRQVLEEHVPPMWDAVVAAGCVVNAPPEGLPPSLTTVAARRSTLEAALRRAVRTDRVRQVAAHVDRIVVTGDRVTGVVAGGTTYDVDRVLVATGRASRLGDDLRPPGQSSDCGQAYVSRMYRARPGVEPFVSWTPQGAEYDGYHAIAFPQDAGTLSVVVLRPVHEPQWAPLWHDAGFQAAVEAIPVLAPWTRPDRFAPITPAARGGSLFNEYRSQGAPPAGVFFVGDAVSTTNPSAGRGVSLGLLQAGALLLLLAEHGDPKDASAAFDAWCDEHVRPWYEDHVAVDASTARRFAGATTDPDAPITSDVVVAASERERGLRPLVFPYLGMAAPPASLGAAHDTVRALLRTGWRPRPSAGPSRDELVGAAAAAQAQAGAGAVPSR